jgi:hypothetical protein
MRILAVTALVISALTASYSLASAQQMTPQQYHKEKGPCACPDDKDKAGKRCGKRSAYCQAGGAEVPRCYLVDVERRKRAACGS